MKVIIYIQFKINSHSLEERERLDSVMYLFDA